MKEHKESEPLSEWLAQVISSSGSNRLSAMDERTESLLRQRTYELEERSRELDFLYGMVKAIERPEAQLNEKLADTVTMMPQAWMNPQLVHVRLTSDEANFATEGFRELPIKHIAQIRVRGKPWGRLEVHGSERGLLNQHKQNLVDEVSERLGLLIEKDWTLAELLENQRFIVNVTDASPNIIYIFDLVEQRNVYVSSPIEKVLGYEPSEIESMGPNFLAMLLHPEDLERVPRLLKRWDSVDDSDVLTVEYRMKARDGSWRWFMARDKVFKRGHGGEVTQIVGTAQDITDRVNSERESRDLTARAQEAQKLESLGVMAGGIAHDFNNLLTSVLGNADLIMRTLSKESSVRLYVEEIIRASRRGADLCNQMLAYAGKGQVELTRFNVSEVLAEMSNILGVSISKKVRMNATIDPDLPLIQADATQIRQIIMNLITNASEAMGDQAGEIKLSTGVRSIDRNVLLPNETEVEPGEFVWLSVSDTGEGMDEKTLNRIFDPFFTTKFTGRGLGLAAVMGIVRAHGGFIRIESSPGKGSVFSVFFPVCDDQEVEDGTAGEQEAMIRGTGTILLVDDEESVRGITRLLLERIGFNVIEACDGSEAIDLFRAHHRELAILFLDWTMPNLDGADALRELKRISDDVPIVIMSGYTEGEVTRQLGAHVVASYLQKPFRLSTLEQVIKSVWVPG